MRVCTSCEVSYEDFGQRSSLCRPCKQAYDRAYHARRSKEQKTWKQELQRKLQIEKRQFMYDYLLSHPCVVCGEDDPVVLEFDHVDRSTKDKAVSNMVVNSIAKIKTEIEKCRVLCANCHKRHTATQLGWYTDLKK